MVAQSQLGLAVGPESGSDREKKKNLELMSAHRVTTDEKLEESTKTGLESKIQKLDTGARTTIIPAPANEVGIITESSEMTEVVLISKSTINTRGTRTAIMTEVQGSILDQNMAKKETEDQQTKEGTTEVIGTGRGSTNHSQKPIKEAKGEVGPQRTNRSVITRKKTPPIDTQMNPFKSSQWRVCLVKNDEQ
jgi:hypothetical protein